MLTVCSSSAACSKQLTLEQSTDCARLRHTRLTSFTCNMKIREMIAIDCHPLSIVRDPGFVSLMNTVELRYQIPSRKYLTDQVISEIVADVKAKVKYDIKNACWLRFTSGVWSTEVSNDSLLSLTALCLPNH